MVVGCDLTPGRRLGSRSAPPPRSLPARYRSAAMRICTRRHQRSPPARYRRNPHLNRLGGRAHLSWLNRNRRLAKDVEATVESSVTRLYIASVKLMSRVWQPFEGPEMAISNGYNDMVLPQRFESTLRPTVAGTNPQVCMLPSGLAQHDRRFRTLPSSMYLLLISLVWMLEERARNGT